MKPQISQINTDKKLVIILLCVLSVSSVMVGCGTTEKPVASSEQRVERETSSIPATHYSLLIKQLGSDDWPTRENAQKTLEEWDRDKLEELETVLKEAVKGDNPEIRSRAIRILKIVQVKLRVKFSDGVLKEFPNIYYDLAKLDVKGKYEILLQITKIERGKIKYQDKIINQDIAGLIGEILFDGGQGLTDKQKFDVISICNGLCRDLSNNDRFTGHHIPEAAPYLIKLLKDEDTSVRSYAVCILGELGYREAIPDIINLLSDKASKVRISAASALSVLRVKEATPEIMKLLKDESFEVRFNAACILGILGAKESIPEIIKLLNDSDQWVRSESIKALGRLEAKESIREIIKTLADESSVVRHSAVETLVQLCNKDAIPEITKCTEDQDQWVRVITTISLIELGAKEKVPRALIKDIRDILSQGMVTENYYKRAQAALKELGVEVEKEDK